MLCKNGHIISGSYCSICEEKPEKKKPKQIKKVSDRRAKQNEQYSIERKNYLALKPFCEVCGCEATEIHHKKSRVEKMLLDIHYWMAVCRECHNEIHANPEYSYQMGYLIKRLGK